MSWVAVGVAGASLVTGAVSAEGGKKAGRAAGQAANDQAAMSQRMLNAQNANIGVGRRELNASTVAGLASLDRDIANQERNLSRQEQMISQLDPTIIEASQQALKLMRGEDASTLAPLKRQREMQRQKLLSSLREQLGPGAETSTMGIQALNRFDAETSNIFSGAQQQALSNLGSVSTQFSSQRPDMLREIAGLSGFGQQKYQMGLNKANYSLGVIGAMNGGNAQHLQSAGAGQVSAMMAGQQQNAWGNQLAQSATQMGTAYLMRQPSSSPTNPPGTSPKE